MAQICERYGVTPGELGFDPTDPRIYINMNIALNVFEVAISRKRWKKSSDGKSGSWEKNNPDGAKLLAWASKKTAPTILAPGMVAVTIPERK